MYISRCLFHSSSFVAILSRACHVTIVFFVLWESHHYISRSLFHSWSFVAILSTTCHLTIIFFLFCITMEFYKCMLLLHYENNGETYAFECQSWKVWSFSFKCFMERWLSTFMKKTSIATFPQIGLSTIIKQKRENYLPFNGRFNMYWSQSRLNVNTRARTKCISLNIG